MSKGTKTPASWSRGSIEEQTTIRHRKYIITSHSEGDRFCGKMKRRAEEQGAEVPIFNAVVKVGLTKKVKSLQRPEDLKEGRELGTWIREEQHSRQQEEPVERARRHTWCF